MDNYQQQPDYNMNRPQPQPYTYIGLVEAVKICFTKYIVFNGRATRAEYWWWTLFTTLVCAVLYWNEYLSGAASLAFLLPSLAVSWRRMHDIGKGGGWYFILLIPVVGWIIWIVWCCQPSEPFDNRFGPQPF